MNSTPFSGLINGFYFLGVGLASAEELEVLFIYDYIFISNGTYFLTRPFMSFLNIYYHCESTSDL